MVLQFKKITHNILGDKKNKYVYTYMSVIRFYSLYRLVLLVLFDTVHK